VNCVMLTVWRGAHAILELSEDERDVRAVAPNTSAIATVVPPALFELMTGMCAVLYFTDFSMKKSPTSS